MPDAPLPNREEPGANGFWDFSLAAYGRPGVAPACLALQDRHGLDVNLLLFCAWCGGQGRPLARADLERLDAMVAAWRREVVLPLRAARRWMKSQETAPEALSEPLRAEIKRQELEAERIEQEILYAEAGEAAGAASPAVAAANMQHYMALLGSAVTTTDIADLAAVLSGCFEEVPPLEAVWMFEN